MRPKTTKKPQSKHAAKDQEGGELSTPPPVFRQFMLTPGTRQGIAEEYTVRGRNQDRAIVDFINMTDPDIDFSKHRVLYEMRLPPDADEKLCKIAAANNMTINDALCAIIDDAMSLTSPQRAERWHAHLDRTAAASGPKATYAEAAKGRKTGPRSRGE